MATPKIGDAFRMTTGGLFMDAVVVRVDEENKTADLARPYLYASEHGAPLVGVEMVDRVPFDHIATWPHMDEGRVR